MRSSPLMLLCGVLAACGGGATARPDAVADAASDAAADAATDAPPGAPLLDPTHLGWKSQHCDACHDLPRPGHVATDVWACASCHGANGACDPNGTGSARAHASTDACTGCHQGKHGFAADSQCASCHFAARGVVTCPKQQTDGGTLADAAVGDGGLRTDLTDNCFGWPATEFSPTNKAAVATFLAAGGKAVDFTLKDTAGANHSLGGLLATKPVLLVHGAFT